MKKMDKKGDLKLIVILIALLIFSIIVFYIIKGVVGF